MRWLSLFCIYIYIYIYKHIYLILRTPDWIPLLFRLQIAPWCARMHTFVHTQKPLPPRPPSPPTHNILLHFPFLQKCFSLQNTQYFITIHWPHVQIISNAHTGRSAGRQTQSHRIITKKNLTPHNKKPYMNYTGCWENRAFWLPRDSLMKIQIKPS